MRIRSHQLLTLASQIILVLFVATFPFLPVSAQSPAPQDVTHEEHPPVPAQHPAAPLREDVWEHAANCNTERCTGTVPAAQPRAAESEFHGKHSRGSNSQLALPLNLQLADVNADGATDFLQYAGNRLFASNTNFEQTGILHLYLQLPIKRILTGDFRGANYDQTCVVTVDNALVCFGISDSRHELWWWFTQGVFAGDDEDMIVGEFDGDGRDDVLVYSRAGGPYRLYSVKGDYFFDPTPAFSQGNLEGIVGRGMQVRAGDFTGDGRDDLLIVNPAGQILRYDSVWDGANNTFWWAFTTVDGFVNGKENVTAAHIDDDLVDDVILRDRDTGSTRFFHLEWADGWLPPITNVATGQIDQAGNRLLFWGFMHGGLDEPGAGNRDDALVYDLGSDQFIRSDARWDGSNFTYWWAYTQNAPYNHTGWADSATKRWITLKCKFSDVSTTPQSDQYYQDLNAMMVEYWRDISYGSWDLSSSYVDNNWYQMPITNADWIPLDRGDKIQRCISAYGGSVDGYGVIAIVNAEGDAGAAGNVLVPPSVSNLTFVAHETGHIHGWWHSFDDSPRIHEPSWPSTPGEYYDHWDIMSAMDVFAFAHPRGFIAGPELNAPMRTFQALIPAHRIMRLSRETIAQGVRVNMAALNHPETRGPLMIRIGDDDNNYFTVEYRMQNGWDQGIPQRTILVHRVTNGTPYLITGGGTERLVGSAYTFSSGSTSFTLRVNGLAEEGYTADVTIDGICETAPYQVAVFEHIDYQGACTTHSGGDYGNSGAIGLPDNAVSSIKIGPGGRAVLCDNEGLGGACEEIIASDSSLLDNWIGNDTVSSLRASCYATSNQVAVFEHPNHTGLCTVKSAGEHPTPLDIGIWNDTMSSIFVGSNIQAILCGDDWFGGICERFTGSDTDLVDNQIGDNQVSSLRVEWAPCEPGPDQVGFYVEAGFVGQCVLKSVGSYQSSDTIGLPNDAISSIRVGRNVAVYFCSESDFGGACESLVMDDGNLTDNSVGNDQISSASVMIANHSYLPLIQTR